MRHDAGPWYREPWPWILMSGPAIVVVAGFVTLGIALATDDGLVADDYYKQGLAVNQVLRRGARARELHLAATAILAGDEVRVTLRGAGEILPELRLRLVHATRSGRDQVVMLRPSGPVYAGRFVHPGGEPRLLVLEDAGSSWRLTGSWNGRDARAELGPGG
ncbi:MAG TPA: FixH family protein [Burkholderiales bacterium]|nr:FixH family protein [Burkholderiales bacterium]